MRLCESIILLLVAGLSGLYINLLTSQMVAGNSFWTAVKSLSGWNISLLGIAGLVWFQRYVANLNRQRVINFKDNLIERMLAAAALSLTYPDTNRHIRGIVTVYNPRTNTRHTRYSYNTEGDPEHTVGTFPADFGVTGEAFTTKSVVVKELPPGHHQSMQLELKSSVLPEVNTILAAPILSPFKKDAPPLGVLAFDSILPLASLGVDKREAREIAQRWADIIGYILVAVERDSFT